MKKVTLIFICLVLILCMTACSVRPQEESKEDLNARALGHSFEVVNKKRKHRSAIALIIQAVLNKNNGKI